MASPLQLPDSTSPDWDSMMNFSESFDMPSFDEQPEKDMDGSEMHGIGPYMQIPTPPVSVSVYFSLHEKAHILTSLPVLTHWLALS